MYCSCIQNYCLWQITWWACSIVKQTLFCGLPVCISGVAYEASLSGCMDASVSTVHCFFYQAIIIPDLCSAYAWYSYRWSIVLFVHEWKSAPHERSQFHAAGPRTRHCPSECTVLCDADSCGVNTVLATQVRSCHWSPMHLVLCPGWLLPMGYFAGDAATSHVELLWFHPYSHHALNYIIPGVINELNGIILGRWQHSPKSVKVWSVCSLICMRCEMQLR